MLRIALLILVVASAAPAIALAAEGLSAEQAAYRQVIRGRAEKIVARLALEDQAQADRVTTLIANYYRGLRDQHDARDAQLEQLGEEESAREQVRSESQLALQKLHRQFVARLTAELPAEQVNQVKDGLTYGVVNVTMGAYRALLPDLTEEEDRYIHANLIEAREYAMDGGSSHEKHGWFGKYKGRINNYLSARGYDLKQAERELAERQRPIAEPSTSQE